jgi:hypothetical protein
MSRPFYELGSYDQNDVNLLTRIDGRDGGFGVPFEYLSAFCPACGDFNRDAVFEKGFEITLRRIRVRKGRNFLVTDDHFLCVSPDLLKALKTAGVKGFESKPLYTGMYWHVLRITNRRSFDSTTYTTDPNEKPCLACKRVRQSGGIRHEREIDLPSDDELTFFSTDKERGVAGFEIFVTDRLRALLQQTDAKGGELFRLFTAEEERQLKENTKWKRKDYLIGLGQHRYGPTD